VAEAMTAVEVIGRCFDRQIDVAKLRVCGHWRPYRGVTGHCPTVLLPRVVAKLAWLRNGMEGPLPLARPHVVSTHVSSDVSDRLREREESRSNNSRVADDHRRRAQPDQTVCWSGPIQLIVQVDRPLGAERGNGLTGLRVQRNQVITGRDVENAVVAMSIGPVRDASMIEPRRLLPARPLVVSPHPEGFARRRIDGDDIAANTGGGVQD